LFKCSSVVLSFSLSYGCPQLCSWLGRPLLLLSATGVWTWWPCTSYVYMRLRSAFVYYGARGHTCAVILNLRAWPSASTTVGPRVLHRVLDEPLAHEFTFSGVSKLTCYGQILRAYELPSAAAPTATPTCIAYAHLQPRGQLGLHHFGHGHLDADSACRLDFANMQHSGAHRAHLAASARRRHFAYSPGHWTSS
jgi:hypothetical protein